MNPRTTNKVRRVMKMATQEAQRFNHEYVGTEHILLGLFKEGSGLVANLRQDLNIDLRKIRVEIERIIEPRPDMVVMDKLPLTPRAQKVIAYSADEARRVNHTFIDSAHLLLGLLRDPQCSAARILTNLSLNFEDLRNRASDFVDRAARVD